MLDAKLEQALKGYATNKLTLVQAADQAGLSFFDFQALLRDFTIPQHYSIRNFEQDLSTIRELDVIRRQSK